MNMTRVWKNALRNVLIMLPIVIVLLLGHPDFTTVTRLPLDEPETVGQLALAWGKVKIALEVPWPDAQDLPRLYWRGHLALADWYQGETETGTHHTFVAYYSKTPWMRRGGEIEPGSQAPNPNHEPSYLDIMGFLDDCLQMAQLQGEKSAMYVHVIMEQTYWPFVPEPRQMILFTFVTDGKILEYGLPGLYSDGEDEYKAYIPPTNEDEAAAAANDFFYGISLDSYVMYSSGSMPLWQDKASWAWLYSYQAAGIVEWGGFPHHNWRMDLAQLGRQLREKENEAEDAQ